MLQARVDIAGIEVQRMDLMEIAYTPDVASSLLQIQQAGAKVDARKLIVQGAVDIVSDAIDGLEEQNVRLPPKTKSDLVKRMMVISCADQSDPSGVISV